MHRISVLALGLTVGLALGVQSISAQSTNASLVGRITDPSQARIAGARVAAINTATSSRYEAPSNASANTFWQTSRPAIIASKLKSPASRNWSSRM